MLVHHEGWQNMKSNEKRRKKELVHKMKYIFRVNILPLLKAVYWMQRNANKSARDIKLQLCKAAASSKTNTLIELSIETVETKQGIQLRTTV